MWKDGRVRGNTHRNGLKLPRIIVSMLHLFAHSLMHKTTKLLAKLVNRVLKLPHCYNFPKLKMKWKVQI